MTVLAANVYAGSAPSPQLKIIALEMIDGEHTLRVFAWRRIEFRAPPLDVNPASCDSSKLTKKLHVGLIKDKSPDNTKYRNTHYFDLPLGDQERSAAEQRQLISESFAAFVDSLPVQLFVRDDICTPLGTRQISGIRVLR